MTTHKTSHLNASLAKLKLLIMKAKNASKSEELRLYYKYRYYNPVGQVISTNDPYGEENWEE